MMNVRCVVNISGYAASKVLRVQNNRLIKSRGEYITNIILKVIILKNQQTLIKNKRFKIVDGIIKICWL
jgi:hypothetical protein